MVLRARHALTHHALLKVFDAMHPDAQANLANQADKLVDDIATATQDRRYLRGDELENVVDTSAIFGNGLCAMIRLAKSWDDPA